MADTDSYTKYKQNKTEEIRANPSKFNAHFLYKALIVSIFLVVLPLFPSQAPEFFNQNLLSRSRELLHLLFVGIAVSYGLFSHRNGGVEKENNNHSKFDNAQAYVSRFLQVSSVFDDENENFSGPDENKVQTWSNQYYRNEAVVVVAKDHSVLDQEQRSAAAATSRIGDKPLLLPVRSLKSLVSDSDNVETKVKSSSLSRSGSNSGSRRFSSSSNKIKSVELVGFDHNVNLEEKLNENVALPSPIPWRSRSGRMEMGENVDSPSPSPRPPLSARPPMEESEFSRLETRSLRSQMPRSSRPNNSTSSSPSLSSPKKLSPSPSLSSESQAKDSEDFARKKSFYRHPPPPPPPPPSTTMHKSSSKKLGSRLDSDGVSMGRSVRTIRSNDTPISVSQYKEIDGGFNGKSEKKSKEDGGFSMEKGGRENLTFDRTPFKPQQLSRDKATFMPKPTSMEFPKQVKQEFSDKVIVETDDDTDIDENDDEIGESPFDSSLERCSNNEGGGSISATDGGPDVDKKADEFIAKFREQIRLQRIESIKRSSAQISRNSSR